MGSEMCIRDSGYSASVRPPVSYTERVKIDRFAAYGIHDALANYELDHLIPLELGGAPRDVGNLWPEPWESRGAHLAPAGQGAESKDRVENALHDDVCGGRMSLSDAQHRIATNWMTATLGG